MMPPPDRQRVLLLGSTGTIGRATLRALVARGHEVVCVLRQPVGDRVAHPVPPGPRWQAEPETFEREARVSVRHGQLLDRDFWVGEAFAGAPFDAVVSCLASRTGVPADAWAVDHQAHVMALAAAQAAGVRQMVLLSAICVQRPVLAFQHAKLAFERQLIDSGMAYSIVRPTAFFKSLSGQVERVRQGGRFMMFGDGRLTSCKPIDDDELGAYIAECLTHPERLNRILPIGGPGPAITPYEQGERLFEMLGRRPHYRRVPVRLLDLIIGGISTAGRLMPSLADRAELARIGRYYATESMLVWDAMAGRYDPDATPETGSRTLWDHYRDLIEGRRQHARSDHSVF